jgi:hypothetical protein
MGGKMQKEKGKYFNNILLISTAVLLLAGCDKYVFEGAEDKPIPPASVVKEEAVPTPTTTTLPAPAKKPDEPPAPVKPIIKKITAQELPDKMQITVLPTQQEERYVIYFSWPLIEDFKKVRISRNRILSVVESSQNTFSNEVDHNQTLNFKIDVLDQNMKVENSFTKQVLVPRDFVVRAGQDVIKENPLNVNRFFMHEVPLKTNGEEVNIKANEFFADNSVIETFPEGSKAPLNVNGRSGGSINLNFTTAVGNLKVYMRGENGGDGSNGSPYTSRARDGSPAGDGQAECDTADDRGRGGRGDIRIDNFKPDYRCSCNSMGANAGNGESGAQGRQGYPAKNGGNAGDFKISVLNGNTFEVFVTQSFGVAGTPGAGGEGQDGGLGGPKLDKKCSGNAGSNGAKGPAGLTGFPGNNGKLGSTCIYIESIKRSECS